MSEAAKTLPKAQMSALDIAKWTAIAISTPGVALICTHEHLGILVAKSVVAQGSATVLRGVQWTRIPTGWQLWMIRLLSRFYAVRLPDEWLFEEVRLIYANHLYKAVVTADGKSLPETRATQFPMRPLTFGEYHNLIGSSGRVLLSSVMSKFRTDLVISRPQKMQRPHFALARLFRRSTPIG